MIINKLVISLKRFGIIKTIRICFNYPITLSKRKTFKENLERSKSTEDKFTWIYKNNWWNSEESHSGSGSTFENTENLRKELPKIITKFNIATILDAPCGDFNWMKELLPSLDVRYIGADIVQDLVDINNSKYQNESITFVKLNIVSDNLPHADLLICRDCLFHLSFEDIRGFLNNFINSNISYLLTTTHKNKNNFKNSNIQTGDFRLIDLFSYPFNFPTTPLIRIDDFASGGNEREMCLFTREQILSIEL